MTLRIGRLRDAKRCAQTKVCGVCGETFRPWVLGQKLCSRACQATAQTKEPNATCKQCGAPFRRFPSSTQRYCSRRCGWDARVDRSWTVVRCLNCSVEFRRRSQPSWAKARRLFCSKPCAQTYTSGEHHPAWRGGAEPYYGRAWGRLAESIRERDQRKCRHCGKSEAENGRRLPVDHVIPRRAFADIEEANQPQNLVAVCDSCHGKKSRAERLWLQGDVLDMWRYQVAVAQPWTKDEAKR